MGATFSIITRQQALLLAPFRTWVRQCQVKVISTHLPRVQAMGSMEELQGMGIYFYTSLHR